MKLTRIRPLSLPQDNQTLLGLDTSVDTSARFDVYIDKEHAIELRRVVLSSALKKRFPLTLDSEPWTDGWVLESNGEVKGFIVIANSAWNKRVVISHFYVGKDVRRQGFGRRLLSHALSQVPHWGALTAWAETSNLNTPGIAAYERLGFTICGFDTTLYRGTPNQGEFAIFLFRDL